MIKHENIIIIIIIISLPMNWVLTSSPVAMRSF